MKINLITSCARLTEKQIKELKSLGDFRIIDAQDTEILIAGPSGIKKIDKEILSGLKNLKYVSTLTLGII